MEELRTDCRNFLARQLREEPDGGGDVPETLLGDREQLQRGLPASAVPPAAALEDAGPNVQIIGGGQVTIGSLDLDVVDECDNESMFQSEGCLSIESSCSCCFVFSTRVISFSCPATSFHCTSMLSVEAGAGVSAGKFSACLVVLVMSHIDYISCVCASAAHRAFW